MISIIYSKISPRIKKQIRKTNWKGYFRTRDTLITSLHLCPLRMIGVASFMGVIEKGLSGYGFPKMLEARLLIRPAANFPYMMEVRSPLKYMLNKYLSTL